MASETFRYQDCELDFGNCSFGGDWTLSISTADEGLTFKLIDAESVRQGVSKTAFALIQEWIDDDTAPRQRKAGHVSKVRKAYESHLADRTPDDDADDLGCHVYHQRAA